MVSIDVMASTADSRFLKIDNILILSFLANILLSEMLCSPHRKKASALHKFKMAMKQPTLASFNFKRLSNDQDGPSPSSFGENTKACLWSIPDVYVGPNKENCLNPSSWLSQFDLLRSDKKNGTMHFQCFILMKILINPFPHNDTF